MANNVRVRKSGGRDGPRAVALRRDGHPLFPDLGLEKGEGVLATLLKVAADEKAHDAQASNKGSSRGRRARPFNFAAVVKFKTHNVHHSTCIEAKKTATIGLGFEDSEETIEKELDPLCPVSFHHLTLKVVEDYHQVGGGWIEVVRRNGEDAVLGRITGLHHCPTLDVDIVVENDRHDHHFEVRSEGGQCRKFARYGDKERFLRDNKGALDGAKPEDVSELIYIPEASSLSRWYGFPSWMAAVAAIELVQAMMQHQFDFHMNRGVPEFMLFVLGQRVADDSWKKIEDSLNATVGMRNSHKSFAVNLTDPDIKVQLEKLAIEGTQEGSFFKDMMETLALAIVSAHRVPPTLAGILIPGKMGAANEASNAIMSFQSLVVGPTQKTIEDILGATLGNRKLNGGLALRPKHFKLKTIVDEMAEQMKKLEPADTMGRMRDELPQAAAEGRAPSDGLQKAQAEILKRGWEMFKGLLADAVTEVQKAARTHRRKGENPEDCVKRKVPILRHEGMAEDQAVAAAHEM